MIWTATNKLRWVIKVKDEFHGMANGKPIIETTKVLQQRWISNEGKEEWRDIPTILTET